MARHYGIRAKSIILLPLGGITQLDDSQPPPEVLNEDAIVNSKTPKLAPWQCDIRIAMAGPLTNLLVALVSAVLIL